MFVSIYFNPKKDENHKSVVFDTLNHIPKIVTAEWRTFYFPDAKRVDQVYRPCMYSSRNEIFANLQKHGAREM